MRLTHSAATGLAVGALALAGAGTAIACTGGQHPDGDSGDATTTQTTTTTAATTPTTTTTSSAAATTSKRTLHRSRHHARRS
jgi:nicotinamide mononucleotide (NMN) deamidase PncC